MEKKGLPLLMICILTLGSWYDVVAATPSEEEPLIRQSISSNAILNQITAFIQKNQLDEAIHLALEHLKLTPNDDDMMLILGSLYYKKKMYPEAEKYFYQILQLSPNYLEAYIQLARTKLAENKYEDAKQLLMRASAVSSLDTAASLKKMLLLSLEEHKERPDDLNMMFIVGLLFFQLNEFDQAGAYFSQILQKIPNDLNASIELAKVKITQKKLPEAARLINHVMTLAPEHVRVKDVQKAYFKTSKEMEKNNLINEIKQLVKKNQFDKALALSEKFDKENPNDMDMMFQLGFLYYVKKNFIKAEAYYQKVLMKEPNHFDAKLGLVRVMIVAHKLKEASNLLNQIKKASPHDPQVLELNAFYNKVVLEEKAPTLLKANVSKPAENEQLAALNALKQKQQAKLVTDIQRLKKEKKYEEALGLSLSYLKDHPKDTDILIQVGFLYYVKKEYQKSEAYYNKALELSANNLDASLGLIRLKIVTNQLQTAWHLLKPLLKTSGSDPQVVELKKFYNKVLDGKQVEEINRLFKANKLEKAKTLICRYLEKNPQNIDMRLILAQIHLKQKQYDEAVAVYQELLCHHPNNLEAQLGLVDVKLARNRDVSALRMVNHKLGTFFDCFAFTIPTFRPQDLFAGLPVEILDPNNKLESEQKAFYLKKIQIFETQRRYAVAAAMAKDVLMTHPKDKGAIERLDSLNKINPFLVHGLNEIGVNSGNDYVSDLHTVWDYSTAHYTRDLPIGALNAQLNFATRFGIKGVQEELDFNPVISKNFSIQLEGKHSGEPALFPMYVIGAEPYVAFKDWFTLSFGDQYNFVVKHAAFYRYTASITKYIKKYSITFRPYHYVPNKSRATTLYTGNITRFFNTNDHKLSLTFGSGRSPDLADLLTLNFIELINNYVVLAYRFPICHHKIVIDISGDYVHWQFVNSGRIRQLYGANAGFSFRF